MSADMGTIRTACGGRVVYSLRRYGYVKLDAFGVLWSAALGPWRRPQYLHGSRHSDHHRWLTIGPLCFGAQWRDG